MSLSKPQKAGGSPTTISSVKARCFMADADAQGSCESSLVPLPLVPRWLFTLSHSPLKFSLCFLMATSYLTVTFVFENLLTQKGNLFNLLRGGLCYWSISVNLRKRKEYSRYKQLVSGWEGLQEYYSWRVLAVNLGFGLCLQAWLLIPAPGLQIPALLLARRMNTIEFYCRGFFSEQKSTLEAFYFLQTFQFVSKSVKRSKNPKPNPTNSEPPNSSNQRSVWEFFICPIYPFLQFLESHLTFCV